MTLIALVVIAACLLAAAWNRENRTIYFLVTIIMLGLWLGPHIHGEREPYCRAGYAPLSLNQCP